MDLKPKLLVAEKVARGWLCVGCVFLSRDSWSWDGGEELVCMGVRVLAWAWKVGRLVQLVVAVGGFTRVLGLAIPFCCADVVDRSSTGRCSPGGGALWRVSSFWLTLSVP